VTIIRRPRQRILGPGDSRAPQRRIAHGLSPTAIDLMRARQGGLCAICQRSGQKLQVDHDHRHCASKTGCPMCVRALICPRCNESLGKIGDRNIDRLIAHLGNARYLRGRVTSA
jgi:hypothetical protein